MPDTLELKVTEFAEQASPGSWFLSAEDEIALYPDLLPYAHYLRQAWDKLGLSGVLCVDRRPAVYLCAGASFTREQKRDSHRFVWNQGLVPLLIFLTPDRVEVHSTVKKPERDPDAGEFQFDDKLSSLITGLGNVAETLKWAHLVRAIETGQFFQDHAAFFPPGETVDRCLIENLKHTARRLKASGWDLPRAHALLGRALFVSFLHERKFIKPHYYPEGTTCLLDILKQQRVGDVKRLLYREFFARLKYEFNGTMFDTALAGEEKYIGKAQLDILADFLSGHDMQSGQMTLDFWAYDFRFIPVETISAIYEEFMKDEDLRKQREEGAYYTPRHLAETTLHVALEGRYDGAEGWRVLDPACGSGIFLVAMFNLFAEQWRRGNSTRRRQTKAQALLDILRQQIRGVDVNPVACRITAFSLYLALFEKLVPMDVDEFKEKVSRSAFLPPLLWNTEEPIADPVVMRGDFLEDDLPLEDDYHLVIGNPPWESRGKEQRALHFVMRSSDFLREGGVGCLLLPSAILVNRNGNLNGDWFREVTVEKIVQLADFREALFGARHPCFILRYLKVVPSQDHTIVYETPKFNRFDRRQGVIVVEPDDYKAVPQRDVLEASLRGELQSVWSRKFWGTPRDEAFLRRLDFFPALSDAITKRGWESGVGFQPYYPGVTEGDPEPLESWRLTDKFLPNDDNFPQLVAQEQDFSTLRESLEAAVHRTRGVTASLRYLCRKPDDAVFTPPMVIYSKGFTKCAFCNYDAPVRFFDGLRSISGKRGDANLLRFLSAVMGSRLFQYIKFHRGSNSGIGRDQLHVYESLALPFPLPDDGLAPPNAKEIVSEAAGIVRNLERSGRHANAARRADMVKEAVKELEPLVEAYYSVTAAERILIEDTLDIYQPSIHRWDLDADIPTLAFPTPAERKRYAETLCEVLNRLARKQGIKINAEARVSETLNLILMTVVFTDERRPYREVEGEEELWQGLDRAAEAARREEGVFSYLRGFNYIEPDRLHMLKPATLRNWSRSAALNDADAIFEYLVSQNA
ncbi:MAG: class I SAM-dependent DNA methyltransferase [Pyrinomonadaceae bacterium]